jgi:hypothetical protein
MRQTIRFYLPKTAMPRAALLVALAISLAAASAAEAQLIFQNTLDKYEHPKSEWETWSKTKPGDFVEYSDGMKVFARFEAIEVGDNVMKIRATTRNDLTKNSDSRDITHVFNQEDRKFGLPTSATDDKLKLGDREFAARKEQWLGIDKKPVKEVWFSEALPFDGMLKYQQYLQGAPSAERVVSSFKKGSVVFGKPEEKPAEVATPKPQPETKPEPKPTVEDDDPPATGNAARVWTSADGKQKLEAKLVRSTSTTVVLQRTSDGKEVTLRLSQLSKADREYLQGLKRKPK